MRSFALVIAIIAVAAASASALAGQPETRRAHLADSKAPMASSVGPFSLDAKGKCHAANGQFVATALCATKAATAPNCKPGKSKPCGHTCIALNKTCHL